MVLLVVASALAGDETGAHAQNSNLTVTPALERTRSAPVQSGLQAARSVLPVPALVRPSGIFGGVGTPNLNVRPQFVWRRGVVPPGALAQRVESHLICVYEVTRCDTSGPGLRELFSGIGSSATSFTPPEGLSYQKFQGKRFEWAVAACAPAGADNIAPPCVWSEPLSLTWPLAPPVWGEVRWMAPIDAVARFRFQWNDIAGAEYYLLCMTTGSIRDCNRVESLTARANPLIRRSQQPFLVVSQDAPQFRGEEVQWTVAVCSETLDPSAPCTYRMNPSQPWTFSYPNYLRPPILDVSALREVRDDRPIEMRWTVDLTPHVSHVKLCALLDEGRPFRTNDCDARNVMQNAERRGAPTQCVLRRPLPGWPSRDDNNVGFAVAACNAANQCWWSEMARIGMFDMGPYGPRASCD